MCRVSKITSYLRQRSEICLPDTFIVSVILSRDISKSVAISSTDGSRSCSCSKRWKALFILFNAPTWFRGSRTIRDCSANACKIDCRIHHTAYEMNLNPLVSSNFSAALIKPRLPSSIRSGSESPWFWYCLATDTTKRKFARTSLSRAAWSPLRILCANSTSCSIVISSSLPISCRYLSRESLSRLVIEGAILSCLIV